MQKNEDKKSADKSGYKFSRGLCAVFLGLCRFVAVFFGARIKKSKAFKDGKRNGAMLVLANHLSAFDFIFFASPFVGKPLNFVVAENMMYSTPIFATLIKRYNAITKKQFYADFQCIKNIKKCLDSGVSVLICPEGKVSADGKTGTISPSIARLIQWLGYPVSTVKLSGTSFVRPKWASNTRFGRIEVNCDILFTAEEAKALPKDEVLQAVNNALAHNEHKWQEQSGHKYVGAHYARGLNRLLYCCPKCHSEIDVTTESRCLVCANCGNRVEYKNNGKLVAIGESVSPERVDLWFDEQRKVVAEQIAKDDFLLESMVHLFVENDVKNGYRYVCCGRLTLNRDMLVFDSNQQERPKKVISKYGVNAMEFEFFYDEGTEAVEKELCHLEFPLANTDTIANMPGTSIDMYDANHVYRFMFEKGVSSTKFVLAIEELFKLRG